MEQQTTDNQQTTAVPAEIVEPRSLNDVEENKDIAALSYAWVLSVAVYLAKRNSPFVRFHAKQGILLFILSVVFWSVPMVGKLLELVVLAFCAMGFIAAAQGQWKDLPFIGAVARGDWKALRTSWRSTVHSAAEAWSRFRKEHHHDKVRETPAPAQPAATPDVVIVPPAPTNAPAASVSGEPLTPPSNEPL